MNENVVSYPKLTRIKHNDYYSGLVQNLFCGKEGKVASFLQFTYQANILTPFGSTFARLFSSIANDELYHIKLLSETIISLGGDPVYASAQGLWLGGRWIDYVKDIKQMLFLNIENKEKSIIDYKTTISKIDDSAIKQMLTLILKQENDICKQLKAAYQETL
jgi:Mn-containing catalase